MRVRKAFPENPRSLEQGSVNGKNKVRLCVGESPDLILLGKIRSIMRTGYFFGLSTFTGYSHLPMRWKLWAATQIPIRTAVMMYHGRNST